MFLVVCILTFKTFLVVYIMIMTGSPECWIVTGSAVLSRVYRAQAATVEFRVRGGPGC